MRLLRVFLSLILVTVASYTSVVVWKHGWGLMPIFLGDMAKMGWPGQFNLDFMCLLALSGLWVSWRHRFSGPGILLGVAAFFGGALFLSVYLLVESFRANGDSSVFLLGLNRVDP